MNQRPLLLELGCEELPSSSLRLLGESLGTLLAEKLLSHGLSHDPAQWFASPRRLAVLIDNVIEQAPDESREALGPPLAQAKDDDDNWTRAAQGFAAKQGLSADELSIIDTPKGPRLGIQRVVAGEKTVNCLLDLVNEAITDLPIAKRMRWGRSRREFVRPVHWVVLMYGEQSGFGDVLGVPSGNVSRGHRFHAPDNINLEHPRQYTEALRKAWVIADFAQRSELIRSQVDEAAKKAGGRALIDEELLEEVSSLVEWPCALSGSFDQEFLDVPAEALISSMQKHQKYFPVVNADGALLPLFVTVSNIESRDPAQVVAGNERVIRPRLADAAFFYQQDLQQSSDERLKKLGAVVFQKQLGSVLDKTRRVQKLAGALAKELDTDVAATERAAELCKTDLVSEMVLEFADMQGIAGAYYARNDGESVLVSDAVGQHYWPTQAGSELPQSAVALAVALADRFDTLVGIFGIGQTPSGSKDPFALRRASIAVLRILIEKQLDLDLRDCLQLAQTGFTAEQITNDTANNVLEYILDRLPALYEGEEIPVEIFRAVRLTQCTRPLDFDRRVRAVQLFLGQSDAAALAAANKRVGNILAKASGNIQSSEVSADLLQETAEKALFHAIEELSTANASSLAAGDYASALGRLAALRAPVDAFFDDVMVNAEDPALKENRLALLSRLRAEFLAIADISQLAT
ncbi:MAG: glycine--tRNA ligase subunit beta [Congregibacter sp.]